MALAITVIAFAFADTVTSLMPRGPAGEYPKFSIYFRMFFEVTVLCWLFFYKKMNKNNLLIIAIISILFLTYFFGFCIFSNNVGGLSLYDFIYLFNKYVFVFICFLFVYSSMKKMGYSYRKKIFKIYELVIYVYCFCTLVLGFILKMPAFFTYEHARFGFIGTIPAQNEASLFIIIALFYGCFVYRQEKRLLPLVAAFISGILLGTKAAFITSIAIPIWFLLKFYPKTGRIVTITALACLTIIAIIYSSQIVEYLYVLEALSHFTHGLDKGVGVLSVLLSGRDVFWDDFIWNLSLYGNINFLFGGGRLTAMEMDFFDTFLEFGLFGLIIYLIAYFVMFKNITSKYRFFFSLLFFSAAFIGGHIFLSAVNALYICLFVCKASEVDEYVPKRRNDAIFA
ncbi:MAG: hypothetical protein LBU89_14670 [Fibromonadaceae bacterium]|jgi:hypothetical protein|nr:hypothetical protein [Fibromonadaceae bacterium]